MLASVSEAVSASGSPPAMGCEYTFITPVRSEVMRTRVSSSENDAPKTCSVS